MKRIKVSIIIYVLNNISYIEKCIRSVMNQTLKEIEILVVDGGSVDGTLELIKNLLQEDARIRLIYSTPGVGRQFNTGLKEANGEYIGICESDDYLLPDMYEKQYELAEKYKLDILRADASHFVEDSKGKEVFFHVNLSKEDILYNCVLDLTQDNRILELGVNSFWSGLYRRDFLLDKKLFMNETRGAAYQDTTFSFLTAIKAKRAMLSKRAFYCYRLDNPNSSMNAPGNIAALIEEYHLLEKRLKEERLFEIYRQTLISWKIKGYLSFYDILLDEQREQYVPLMYQDIKKDLLGVDFEGNSLSKREQEVVEMIRESSEALQKYLVQTYTEFEVMRQQLEQIDHEEIVIFGCGELGKLVYLYMKYTNKEVQIYMDNNSELWGKQIEQVPVFQPEKAVTVYPDAIYIIANVEHSDEMKEQLKSYTIPEDKIIVCNEYDFFWKHILLKAIKG